METKLVVSVCAVSLAKTQNMPLFVNRTCQGVLVLAEIELIFSIVASMGLRFGFVLKTVLIIQRCFRYC